MTACAELEACRPRPPCALPGQRVPPAIRGRFICPRWFGPGMCVGLLGCLLSVASLGCGRKATVEDCEQIVKRIVELELKPVVPEQELGKEVRDAQQQFKDRALADCVGRRITDKSLRCVANAKSTATIIDDCLD